MKNALAVVAVLAAIAPEPGSTDRGFYEQLGLAVIMRDCSDIHCFRPLVAGVLEHRRIPLEQLAGESATCCYANEAKR